MSHPSYRVLVRLAHDALSAVGCGRVDPLDATEELKSRAARARIPYDGDVVRRALDSAEAQRRFAGKATAPPKATSAQIAPPVAPDRSKHSLAEVERRFELLTQQKAQAAS